jgi:hypothetical protein
MAARTAAPRASPGIGALVAAWNDVQPLDPRTTEMVGGLKDTLYDSVANDESFSPAEFATALAKLKSGLSSR